MKSAFSRERLSVLQGLTYKSAALQNILGRTVDLDDGFTCHLLNAVEKYAIAFDSIKRRHNGNACGIEFKQASSTRWAFVLPDVSSPGKMRIQYFDERSFTSHHCANTHDECLEDMVRSGYLIEDQGALDRVSSELPWQNGTVILGYLQQLNAGKITFARFSELCRELPRDVSTSEV